MIIQGICPHCEAERPLRRVKAVDHIQLNRILVGVPTEYWACQVCGGDFNDPADLNDVLERVYELWIPQGREGAW